MIDSVAYEIESAELVALFDAEAGTQQVVPPGIIGWSDDTGRDNNSDLIVGSPELITAGARKRLVMTADNKVPDASGGDVGEGFTNTGLAYDTALDCLWAGNDGRAVISTHSGAQSPSIVQLSRDGTAKLSEIDLNALFGLTGTVQGVVVDTSDGTLWCGCPTVSRIYHVTKDGTDVGDEITFSDAAGLSYNATLDHFYVSTRTNGGTVTRINKSGATQATIDLSGITGGADIDHHVFDQADHLYITIGGNNHSGVDGQVIKVNISDEASPSEVERWVIPEADAIEGVALIGTDTLAVCNDAYAHEAETNRNAIYTYDVSDMPPGVRFNRTSGVRLLDTVDLSFVPNEDSMFMVAAVISHNLSGKVFAKARGSSDREYELAFVGGNEAFSRFGSGNRDKSPTNGVFGAPFIDASHVIAHRADGTNNYVRLDGREGPGVASGTKTTGPDDPTFIGAISNGSGGIQSGTNSTVYRIYVFRGAPSEADMQRVEAEAAKLIGANGRLPSTNPDRLLELDDVMSGGMSPAIRGHLISGGG